MLRNTWIAACVFVFGVIGTRAQDVILEPLISGLNNPVFLTNAHDGTDRKFIIEQAGRILVMQPGSPTASVFLDISNKVLSGGERGLLGLAFHPLFSQNGRFFVDYTRQPDGATVIAQYGLSSSDPNLADPDSEVVLLVIGQPFANHNGGMIEFGPDNFLYIGMGDGGSGNDPQNRAQNPDDLLGKILRIDVDNPQSDTAPYSSPASNPFFGATPGRDEIYAIGFRNPFRFSFDRANGQLYVGDVGQGAREEIDIATLGGNFGWRVFEGTLCTGLDPESCSSLNAIPPVAEYSHEAGRCSVTGGYVYRGVRSSLPSGAYLYADFCTGEIFMLNNGVQTLMADTALSISSFGEDEAGEIYVVGIGGSVFRIAGQTPAQLSQGRFATDEGRVSILPASRSGLPFATGYAWLLANIGYTLPHSAAIFRTQNNGIRVSEVSIPAVQPVHTGRIFVSVSESTATGIAIANPNERPVTVVYYFTDSDGRDSTTRSVTIPARTQINAFFDEEPFSGGATINGTFTFQASAPVAAMALGGVINQRSEFLYSPLQIVSPDGNSTAATVIPYWAQGADRKTEFALVNPSDQRIDGEVRLLTSEGQQWDVLPYSIPPKSSRNVSSAISQPSVQTGSALIVPSEGPAPSATANFQVNSTEGVVTQAAVPAVAPDTAFRGFGEASAAVITNLAVANPSSSPATVTIELTTSTGTGSPQTGTIALPASGQIYIPLNQIPGLTSSDAPFQGMVRVVSSSGPIAVTLLRSSTNGRGDLLLTETAPINESTFTARSQSYFPHIAAGDGSDMQFLFLSSGSGGAQTGTIYFFDESGKPLPLTLEQSETGVCREERRSRWSPPIRICSD